MVLLVLAAGSYKFELEKTTTVTFRAYLVLLISTCSFFWQVERVAWKDVPIGVQDEHKTLANCVIVKVSHYGDV